MTVYLLHFSRSVGKRGVQHYLGATTLPLPERLRRHDSEHGAALLRQIGVDYRVVRVWPVASRDDAFALEIKLKKYHRYNRYCLLCHGKKALFDDCNHRAEGWPGHSA